MTERDALIALNLVSIGSIRLQRLLTFFGTAQEILKAPAAALEAVSGIGEMASAAIRGLTQERVERELREADQRSIRIIVWTESTYPAILKTIPDPPIALYVKGTIPESPGIAIVGSRRASVQGLRRARDFAGALAQSGYTVVSGMARGIDTSAHNGCLDAGGTTIAVMGSGFGCLYPPENALLSERIASHGAVVTEFPLAMKPLPQNFPCRNRIISGFSAGIVIVEAARNSGALITADCALEQGREVFAVPGAVESRSSWGVNALIQQGAHVVLDARDITDIIGTQARATASRRVITQDTRPDQAGGSSSEERLVCDRLSDVPVSFDTIAQTTGMPVERLSGILFALQMKKEVRQLPGKLFIRPHS